MLRVANYARKSVYSDKSDSVRAQYDMSLEYCKSNYEDFEIYKYEDEGYTGANTDRPDYNRLVADIKARKIDIVLCYRIDRISRNILDFSNFYSMLSEYGVEFVSIKEQLDTSTPLGRAMMYICSVFSQMERETTAERVKDNLLQLSKSGNWAGGKAPLGYSRERVIINGKSHTVLKANEEEIPFLNMISDAFLQGRSLHQVESYFRVNNIKTLKGAYFSATQIYNILKNPHYAPADPATYEYFSNLGCTMSSPLSEFDGTRGIIAYGRTSGGKKKKHAFNPPEKWVISVGLHKPIMSSEKWLQIQDRFGKNVFDKTRKHKVGILKGVLRCSCGSMMRVQRKAIPNTDKFYDNYFCQLRNRKGPEYCDRKFTRVSQIDNSVIETLKAIKLDRSLISHYVYEDKSVSVVRRSRSDVLKEISEIESKISNLANTLSDNSSSTAAKYIISEMERLDKCLGGLKYELLEIGSAESKRSETLADYDNKYDMVCRIVDSLETADYDEINSLIKNLFKECVYDGENLTIKL